MQQKYKSNIIQEVGDVVPLNTQVS